MLDKEVAESVDAFVQADAFLEHGEANRAKALEAVLKALQERKCQLLDIVLHLGTPLNDTTNPQARREATRLLSKCLEDPIVEKSLNFKHVLTFVTFFCSKLNDWQCVEGAVTGLTTLLKLQAPQMRTLTEEDGTPIVYTVARTLFKTVHTPSHTQAVRKAILDLTLLLVTEWAHVLESMSELLGDGVISMIEEERDPRNLLLSFHISEVLLKERPERCLSEEGLSVLFEALTSYFPITFTPPKDDKYGITGEDLKAALNTALASSKRMAPLVVPFLLDSSKDVTVGDNEQVIKDALECLGECFEAYGPEVAQKYLVEVLKACRDQVCRTTTPCPDDFAKFLERTLRVALTDMPSVAIEPAWFSKSVNPFLKGLAIEVAKKEASFSISGAKTLLVGAARASPLLLKKVWSTLAPELLPAEDGVCPRQGIRPLLDLAMAADSPSGPLLEARSFKAAMPGVVRTMFTLLPDSTHKEVNSQDDGVEEVSSKDSLLNCFKLLGCMSRLVGQGQSTSAFEVLVAFLFAGYTHNQGKMTDLKFEGVEQPKDWLKTWAESLAEQEDVEVRDVLVEEILSIVQKQPFRALELNDRLVTTLKQERNKDHGFKPIFAQLSVMAILTLVCHAAANAAKEDAHPDPSEASESAEKLLTQLTSLLMPTSEGLDMESLPSVTAALEATASSPGKEMVVSTLANKLGIMETPSKLCAGLGEADASTAQSVQSFLRSILAGLPGEESGQLRSTAFTSAITKGPTALALVHPSVLPVAPAVASMAAWQEASKVLEVACKCVSSHASGAPLELLALEALEALVIASPKDQVGVLLKSVEETFSAVLKAANGAAPEKPEVARGAARCWAAVAGALMRRGGFASEASNFLKDLLAALEQDGAPVAPFVPMAFQVLTPPSFEPSASASSSSSSARARSAGGGSSSSTASPSPLAAPSFRQKLSPIALQQLSQTVLPQLVTAARKIGKQQVDAVSKPIDAGESSPALECAVMLLAALPIEVLVACGEDYRWCTLVGLKSLKATHSANSSPAPLTTRALFAAQVLQLLVRAAKKSLSWVEDDLTSIIPMLTFACTSHPVPLVRLGSLQALQMIIETSQGHILPYKRDIERATRKAVEDRKREVRLVAVACLNAWHCGLTMDRD